MNQIQLPPHWKTNQLGNIVLLKNGINFSSQQKGRGILTVDVLNMYSDSIHLRMDELYRVDKEPGDDYLLQPNDVLFVRSSLKQEGVGWSSLFTGFTEPVTFCGFLIRARLTATEISPEFLINYLRLPSVRRLLISKSGKVSITNINQENIKSLWIPIPPLPEQSAIAHTLRTIQKAKEARQRELELEREGKAALMQHLFTHGTRNEPSQKTKIGEIPESWQVSKLGQLIALGPQNGLYKPASCYGDGVPILRIDAFNSGDIIDTQKLKRLQLSNEELKKYALSEGDIIINRVNGSSEIVGKSALVGQLPEATVFESNMIRFAVNAEELSNNFLIYFLGSNQAREQLRQKARITHQKSLNQQDIKSLLIPLPHISEQKYITDVLLACNRKITALEQEAAFLDELFRAMLEELMTGRLSALPLVEEKALN